MPLARRIFPSQFALLLLAVALILLLGGCGGRKVVPSKPAELVIPPDLAKSFEVKEPTKDEKKAEAKPADKKTKKGESKKKTARKAKSDSVAGPGETTFTVPNRRPKIEPIWIGEKIWMDVTWLSTKAGEFLLEVQPFKEMNGRKVYDLKGTAKTSDLFSLIYKAEDWCQSFVDYEGWFPYKFTLHGDETKHIRDHLELFDHGAKKQYVHIQDNRILQNEVVEKKGVMEMTPFSQDSLSALYYARTLKLDDGAVLKFPMTSGGRQVDTELTVIGREEISTKLGYLRTIKTKVITKFNNVLQQKGDAFLWFTDDDRRIPVRFEAKVRIGWVAGIIKKIEYGTAPDGLQPSATPTPQVTSSPEVKTSAISKKGTPKRRLWFHHLIKESEAREIPPPTDKDDE